MSEAVEPHLEGRTGREPGRVPPNSSAATAAIALPCSIPPSSARPAARASTSTTTTSWRRRGSPSATARGAPAATSGASRSCCRSSRSSAQERVGQFSGQTPLIHADRLGAELGLKKLYLKDDSTNRPTLSYKDRVVGMAIARMLELGKNEIGCVSTGNVGTAVAALAAKAGAAAYIFYPGQHGEGQGEGLSRARRPGLPARRQLRPGQPRLPRAVADQRHAVRQHHPAPVLRRGGEDDGFRGRRGARLDGARPLRDPRRRRHPLLARPQGAERAGDRRPGGDRRHQDQHRPAQRLRPDRRARSSTAARSSPRRPKPPLTPWRSALRATAASWSRRCAPAAARRRLPPTPRSSPRSTCSARPRASSPSRPAAPRSPRPRSSPRRARSAPDDTVVAVISGNGLKTLLGASRQDLAGNGRLRCRHDGRDAPQLPPGGRGRAALAARGRVTGAPGAQPVAARRQGDC